MNQLPLMLDAAAALTAETDNIRWTISALELDG
jgi:hypothetical protein